MQFSETKNLTFRQAAALMFEKLGDSKVMALASSVDDHVMVRKRELPVLRRKGLVQDR